MSNATAHWLSAAMLVIACHAPEASAQPTSATTTASRPSLERQHENALASFRQARFSEAYGRLIALADAGHGPSAELALWMYQHGSTVFGMDWDSTPDQLSAWARLAGQPAPTMTARLYPRIFVPVTQRGRGTAP